MSEKYLLPCTCGKSAVVERRQAGTTVSCECGKPLEVPTIRGFSALSLAERQEPEPPPLWGLWQGLVFLGLMIALPAFAFSLYEYRQIPTLNETLVEEMTMRLQPADSWYMWKVYEQGMPKNPSIESVAVIRGIKTLKLWINIALVIGVGGLLLSAAGLVVRSTAKKAAPARTGPAGGSGRRKRRT